MEVVMNSSKYGSDPMEVMKNNERGREMDRETLGGRMPVQFQMVSSFVRRDITGHQSSDVF